MSVYHCVFLLVMLDTNGLAIYQFGLAIYQFGHSNVHLGRGPVLIWSKLILYRTLVSRSKLSYIKQSQRLLKGDGWLKYYQWGSCFIQLAVNTGLA